MSYTEIYAFGKDGNAYLFKEINNSWRGAMAIWTVLEEKYLPQYRPSYVPPSVLDSELKDYCNYKPSRCGAIFDKKAMQEIWDLVNGDLMTPEERIVLATTFDKVIIARKDVLDTIDAFNKFEGDTSLKEQAEILQEMYDQGDIIAVGWNQTSVNGDNWENFSYDEDEEEYTPYNVLTGTEHQFIFKGDI